VTPTPIPAFAPVLNAFLDEDPSKDGVPVDVEPAITDVPVLDGVIEVTSVVAVGAGSVSVAGFLLTATFEPHCTALH
jgi:hypothetical protein